MTPNIDESQNGGYREDENGVMIFTGKIQEGGAEPIDDRSRGYADGYKAGYDEYYTKYLALTRLIYKTPEIAPPPSTSGAVEPTGAIATSGAVAPTGAIATSGAVEPTGAIATSGAVEPTGAIATSGTVAPTGPIATPGAVEPTGAISTSGAVAPTGPIAISGAVAPTGPIVPVINVSGAVKTSGAKETAVTTEPLDLGQQGGALLRAKRAYKRGKTFSQHAHLLERIKDRTIVV